jgi:hypothetical protein
MDYPYTDGNGYLRVGGPRFGGKRVFPKQVCKYCGLEVYPIRHECAMHTNWVFVGTWGECPECGNDVDISKETTDRYNQK